MDNFNSLTTSSYISRFISFLLYVYTLIEVSCLYIISHLPISDHKNEPETANFIEKLKTTEVSQKYWYLENVLKLEDEINRNIELIGKIFSQAGEDEDIRVVSGIELSKVALLKKGKLKMFRNLCLVALEEIPPIEGDKAVTIDDLEGFWCLLGIEAEKHRQSVIEILEPKHTNNSDGNNGKNASHCDLTDTIAVPVKTNKTISSLSSSKVCKKTIAETKAAMKVNKSNIDERNRKYMERMKKLKERKAKPTIKVQDKENQNPNPISVTSKDELKLKQCDNVLSPRIQSPRIQSPRIQSPKIQSPRIKWHI